MKKIVSLVSAVFVVALFVIVMGGVASAAGTNTLTVNATLTGACQFTSPASETLSFPLDATQSTDVNVTVNTSFWCTKGTAVTAVTTDNGQNFSAGSKRMKSTSTGDFIPYSLVLTPAGTTGLGKTSPINLQIAGTVVNANYVNATAAADYADTVVITITP